VFLDTILWRASCSVRGFERLCFYECIFRSDSAEVIVSDDAGVVADEIDWRCVEGEE
jgi:hypothetical protein